MSEEKEDLEVSDNSENQQHKEEVDKVIEDFQEQMKGGKIFIPHG